MENRTRLIRDIIKETKDIVGDRAIVAVRVSGHEFVEGGLCPEDYQEIIPVLEEAGMDLLHVSAGVYASMERIVPSKHLGNMPHINIVSTIKQYTKVPVCAVGSFFSISMVEEALTLSLIHI